MSNVYTITVAFAPASQVARTLLEYRRYRRIIPKLHVVALGHYPINLQKNNRDINLITESYGDAEMWDPGKDLGSAQTQWWALQRLGLEAEDYWINVDPDSSCRKVGWDVAAKEVLDNDPNCIVVSCMSPMVSNFLKARNIALDVRDCNGIKFAPAHTPIPFNLSMWRYSFFQELGRIPQMGFNWGEVEALVHWEAKERGKYHAFLMDYEEDESGKYLQDRPLLEFKDLNMRTAPPDKFYGIYKEYLRFKYPELESMNTAIPDGTIFQ